MSVTDAIWLGPGELRARIVAGDLSSEEVTELALSRAESLGRDLRAFITVDRDGALAAARRADAALSRDAEPGLLHGVPVTVKDLIRTRRLPTTAGSRALDPNPAHESDAKVVDRLRAAGAVLVGKTSLNEFAYGVTGANHHFGQVENPWVRDRSPGGSSSGSAAAVAAGIGAASVGTDTRGSIRIPASCCGITGLKPTRGLVPTDGVFPLSWTLDHVGPLTRSVEDAVRMLTAMADGPGAGRGASLTLERPVEGLRMGVSGYFFDDLAPEVESSVREALDVLSDLGLEPVEIELPELEPALRASGVIAAAEALVVHDDRIRERPEDYGPDVLERLERGRDLSALDLARAYRARTRLREAYRKAFGEVDCMVGPSLPGLPVQAGASTMRVAEGRDEWVVKASCRLTSPQNMTGAPAVSVPCGFSESGLPVGLQVWARPGADRIAMAVAHRYQQVTDWHRRRPPVPSGG